MHFGRAPHQMPFPALVPIIFAWYLGRQYDKYVYLSTRDTLTGLYNRRYVYDKFTKVARHSYRKKLNTSILLLDINDTYGHDYGDRVLEFISKQLVNSFEGKDIIARWGGDEFLIISPFSDERLINEKVKSFKKEIKNMDWSHIDLHLSLSIGKAIYPLDGDNLKSVVAKADSNMYELKVSHKQTKAAKYKERSKNKQ